MQNKLFYFLGIGGIGMSSIARFLSLQGAQVGGYDKTPSEITSELIALGVQITFDEKVPAIPSAFSSKSVTVIYTPAVPDAHPQKQFYIANGNKMLKRAKFLGELTRNTPTLAVAGTHGKTTTTAILAHLFKTLNQSFTAFVGGVMNESQSNLMALGEEVYLVEADEFDRSFLTLFPSFACITSMDADHLDVYGSAEEVDVSYRLFANQVKQLLVVEKGLLLEGVTYSINEKADYSMTNIKPEGFGYYFDLITPHERFDKLYFSQLGLHNLSNALAAFALASSYGLKESDLSRALSTFKGVKRRLQLHVATEDHVVIDDYAHHPTEIKAVYDTLENAYPGIPKCVVFQPHLFSRTRDFLDDFAAVLSLFDRVILLPIYPARELPIAGVSSGVLAVEINNYNKTVEVMSKEQLRIQFSGISQRIKVILGAGDIGREVEGLKQSI